MDPSVASADVPAKDLYLPTMLRVGEVIAPKAPQDVAAAGLEEGALADLVVKLAYTVPNFTPDWVAEQLHLSLTLVQALLAKLCVDAMVEQFWHTGRASHRYRIAQRGRDHAVRLL